MMLDTFGARHLPGPKRFAKPTALEEAYNQLEVALKSGLLSPKCTVSIGLLYRRSFR